MNIKEFIAKNQKVLVVIGVVGIAAITTAAVYFNNGSNFQGFIPVPGGSNQVVSTGGISPNPGIICSFVCNLTASPNPFTTKGAGTVSLNYYLSTNTSSPSIDAVVYKSGDAQKKPLNSWTAHVSNDKATNTLTWNGTTTISPPIYIQVQDGDYVFEVTYKEPTQIPNIFVPHTGSTTFTISTPPVAPVLTEITAISPNPTSDPTPNWTFQSTEAGTISYVGSCKSSNTNALAAPSTTTITFDQLSANVNGQYNNCSIVVTGNTSHLQSLPLKVSSFKVNVPIVTAGNNALGFGSMPGTTITNATPTFTFKSDQDGTISYPSTSSCKSSTSNTSISANASTTVIFDTLNNGGPYTNCQINVTNSLGLVGTLSLASFTVNVPQAPQTQLVVSCTGTPSAAQVNVTNVTWQANIVTGGPSGTVYTYTWSNDSAIDVMNNLTNPTPHVVYTTTGNKKPSVKVSANGYADSAVTACSNTVVVSTAAPAPTAPTLTEVTPVSTPTSDTTPNWTFKSDQTGTITYTGSCFSSISGLPTSVVTTNSPITMTFNALTNGITYGDCKVKVTNSQGLSTTLNVSAFTVNTQAVLPQLSVSCVGSPSSVTTNQNVTWTAVVNNGSAQASYNYVWSGEKLTGTGVAFNQAPQVSYDTEGAKSAYVVVSANGYQSSAATTCSQVVVNAPVVGGGNGGGVIYVPVYIPSTEDKKAVATDNTCAGFKDVGVDHCAAITYAKSIGAMTGLTSTLFGPNDLVERQQMMKILSKAYLKNYKDTQSYCASNPFPDIIKGVTWSANYVCYAKDQGIAKGYSAGIDKGYFRPTRNVSRAELAALFGRSIGEVMPKAVKVFNDVSTNEWFSRFATWFYNNGIYLGQNFNPGQYGTRVEVAEILYKLSQR